MATTEQCRAALEGLAARLTSVEEHERRQHSFDRSVSCHVPDLGITFSGALENGHIHDITTDPAARAQIRITAQSDDLVALTAGDLAFGPAWISGRVKVEAGVRDLLKLRSML
jgi:predicted lipid carrier protein YhbT